MMTKGDNLNAFIHMYLKDHVVRPFSPMHYEWMDLTDKQYLAIAAPRGFAKSHMFSFFYPLFEALEGKKDIVLVSSTESNAEWFLTKIMRECENNEKIKEDYGVVQGKVWRNNYLEFTNGSTIRCAGSEGKIRGKRPDLIILDDLENSENVLSEDWRAKIFEWFWADALYTLKPHGQCIIIGTLFHPLSLMTYLSTNPKAEGWTQRKYQGLVDGYSIWEDQWPTPELIKRRDLNPAAFEQEIQNNPIPSEWRKFKPENFRYYEEIPNGLVFSTTVDPAFDLHAKADYSVVLTVGTDVYGNHFVVDMTRKRLQPNELIDEIFKHLERWNSMVLGIEEQSFQKTLRYYYDLEAKRRHKCVRIEPLKSDGRRKQFRIEALSPFINQGLIWMHKEKHKELVNELICWPTGDHDDTLDALAYQLDIMKKPSIEAEPVNDRCIKAIINKFYRADRQSKRRTWHA